MIECRNFQQESCWLGFISRVLFWECRDYSYSMYEFFHYPQKTHVISSKLMFPSTQYLLSCYCFAFVFVLYSICDLSPVLSTMSFIFFLALFTSSNTIITTTMRISYRRYLASLFNFFYIWIDGRICQTMRCFIRFN